MPLSWNEISSNALSFSNEWSGAVRERSESQTFWNEFFKVFGLKRRLYALAHPRNARHRPPRLARTPDPRPSGPRYPPHSARAESRGSRRLTLFQLSSCESAKQLRFYWVGRMRINNGNRQLFAHGANILPLTQVSSLPQRVHL